MLLLRSVTEADTCFLFLIFFFFYFGHSCISFLFIASHINSQIDEPPSVIISQCSSIISSIWTFLKINGFQCGSVLFIKWHNSHRGLTVQAVPCTECGCEESEYRASALLTLASPVGNHLRSIISYKWINSNEFYSSQSFYWQTEALSEPPTSTNNMQI